MGGPLLYLIYVSDIPTSNEMTSAMFADDLAMFSRSLDGIEASTNAQQLHLEIKGWANKWQIIMNPTKSFNVTFTFSNEVSIHYDCPSITVTSQELNP